MGYTIATVLVSAVPTVLAVIFVLTRPHLNGDDKFTVFGIWAVIVLLGGFFIYVVTIIILWVTVGDAGEPGLWNLVIAATLSLILNYILVIIAGHRNEKKAKLLTDQGGTS